MSFSIQERAKDPSTGRYLNRDGDNQERLAQSRREYEDKLKATRSKFANVPNAAFSNVLSQVPEEEKMTLEQFKNMSPAQVQHQTSGKETALSLRESDDARAKHYQDQNNTNIKPTNGTEDLLGPTSTPAVTGDGSMAERLALLARKEKAFSTKMLELKAQEEKMKADKASMESSYIPKQKLVDDPFSVLKDNGLTYDQLTEKLLAQNGGVQDPVILELQSQVKELREQLSEQRSSVENKEKQSYEQAVAVQRHAVTSLLDSDPQFEMIKATNSHEDVVQMIIDTFKKDNILLSPMEAAQKVENFLYDEAFKLVSVPKIKAKLGQPMESLPRHQEVINDSKTLTNQMQTDSHLPVRKKASNWTDWKKQTIEKINNRQIS